jgi:hypothetical protein
MENQTVSSDILFEDCTVGDVDSLNELLQNPAYIAKALETEDYVDDQGYEITRPRLNLDVMFLKACAAGSTEIVRCMISFAKAHEIAYEALIHHDSICAAAASDSSVAIFQELYPVKPDVVNIKMGLLVSAGVASPPVCTADCCLSHVSIPSLFTLFSTCLLFDRRRLR